MSISAPSYPVCGRDIERAACSDGDPPDMRSCVFSTWHDRFDQIACFETKPPFLSRHMARWEAIFVCPAHLAGSMSLAGNKEHVAWSALEAVGRAFPDAGSIRPMTLLYPQSRPVPLGTPARANLDHQAGCEERLIQGPSGRVDGCSVLERHLGLAREQG